MISNKSKYWHFFNSVSRPIMSKIDTIMSDKKYKFLTLYIGLSLFFFFAKQPQIHINNIINVKYENSHKQRKWHEINYLFESEHFSIVYLLSMSEPIISLFCCPIKRKISLAISLSFYYLYWGYPESKILSHSPKAEKKCLLRSAQRFAVCSEVKRDFITRDFWPNFTILKNWGPTATVLI